MRKKLHKSLALITAIALISSMPFAVSAKNQNASGKKDTRLEVKIEKNAAIKSDVKVEKNVKKAEKKTEKKAVKDPNVEKLNNVDKKIISIEVDYNKLSKEMNSYITANITTGSAITTTGSAVSTSGTAVSTTGSAVTTGGPKIKGSSLKGFVNSYTGKLNALSNRIKAVEKSLVSIEADKTNPEKYKQLIGRISDLKKKILADTKLLNSFIPKK